MSDKETVRGFFTKYHAVPASNDGPEFSRATDEAVIGWATADIAEWNRGQREPHFLRRMEDIRDDLWRRMMLREDRNDVPGSPAFAPFRNAWFKLCERVGFGPT